MKYLGLFAILLITIVFQLSISDLISVRGISADFVLIVLAFMAIRINRSAMTILGFFTGLARDALSAGVWGLSALTLTISAFVLATIFRKVPLRHSYQPALVTFAVAFLHNILFVLILDVGTPGFAEHIKDYSILSSFYTFIIAFFIFSFLPQSAWFSLSGTER